MDTIDLSTRYRAFRHICKYGSTSEIAFIRSACLFGYTDHYKFLVDLTNTFYNYRPEDAIKENRFLDELLKGLYVDACRAFSVAFPNAFIIEAVEYAIKEASNAADASAYIAVVNAPISP